MSVRKFEMQINMAPVGKVPDWVSIRQEGQEPYRYDSKLEAHRMLRICYPDLCRDQRLGTPGRVRVEEVEVE